MEDKKALARQLLTHFTFEAGEIPPTLSDFRRQAGLSFSAYAALSADVDFAEAIKDARARYLDTLTVGALLKKYDAGFVKYLLDAAAAESAREAAPSEGFAVEVRVVE